MSRILVIDASSEACSVALLNQGEKSGDYSVAPRQHAQLILPMTQKLLAEQSLKLQQLDAVACHVGPGTFTGIRVAVSAAQGLSYGAKLPAIALSSLANLAIQGWSETGQQFWFCALDARMQEVYFAVYYVNDKGQVSLLTDEQVIKPELINFKQIYTNIKPLAVGKSEVPHLSEFGLIGNGWQAYHDALFQPNGFLVGQLVESIQPNAYYSLDHAKQQLENGKLLKAEALQPVYLRNNVAKKQQMSKN